MSLRKVHVNDITKEPLLDNNCYKITVRSFPTAQAELTRAGWIMGIPYSIDWPYLHFWKNKIVSTDIEDFNIKYNLEEVELVFTRLIDKTEKPKPYHRFDYVDLD